MKGMSSLEAEKPKKEKGSLPLNTIINDKLKKENYHPFKLIAVKFKPKLGELLVHSKLIYQNTFVSKCARTAKRAPFELAVMAAVCYYTQKCVPGSQ